MQNSLWVNFISILVAVFLSVSGTFAILKTNDAVNLEKINYIEKMINSVPKIENECNLNSSKIAYHETLVDSELKYIKETTSQLQTTTNLLSTQVSKNSDTNIKILTVLEKLNGSIGGLDMTMARIDERLKTVERLNRGSKL